MSEHDEVLFLLKHYLDVINASKAPNSTDRLNKAKGLILKCYQHCATTEYLLDGTHLKSIQVSLSDYGTQCVALRAALESMLVFGFVFYMPQTDEEFDYRYNLWFMAGLIERQKFLPYDLLSEANKKQFDEENAKIQELKTKIEKNTYFTKVQSDGVKKLLLKGDYRADYQGWVDIGKNLGFDEVRLNGIYKYICSYAHSGGLSALQYSQSLVDKQSRSAKVIVEPFLSMILSKMVAMFCSLFPVSKSQHECNSVAISIVDKYISCVHSPSPQKHL